MLTCSWTCSDVRPKPSPSFQAQPKNVQPLANKTSDMDESYVFATHTRDLRAIWGKKTGLVDILKQIYWQERRRNLPRDDAEARRQDNLYV